MPEEKKEKELNPLVDENGNFIGKIYPVTWARPREEESEPESVPENFTACNRFRNGAALRHLPARIELFCTGGVPSVLFAATSRRARQLGQQHRRGRPGRESTSLSRPHFLHINPQNGREAACI